MARAGAEVGMRGLTFPPARATQAHSCVKTHSMDVTAVSPSQCGGEVSGFFFWGGGGTYGGKQQPHMPVDTRDAKHGRET